jgi:RNA-directed DNA polymerase
VERRDAGRWIVERTDRQEETGTAVPETAKQVSEVRDRWPWAEPAVWTDRMLSALEKGVKGGVWFSLIDKVYRAGNLAAAAEKVIANKGAAGVDNVTVQQYKQYQYKYLGRLSEALRDDTYAPKAIKRRYIPKPGSAERRPLGIPCVEDRVVQTALRNVLEPIFEREFCENSYGFRPGRGCKDALRVVDKSLREGYCYVVDADIRKFFDTISHELLMQRVAERVADSRVLALIRGFLNQQIMEDAALWSPDKGTPQGAVISPLLANVYLNPLDHLMAEHGHKMIRYADDSVIVCRTQAQAEAALDLMRRWCEAQGLTLHPEKTRIANLNEADGGFDFLGYHFQRTRQNRLRRWPNTKAISKLRHRVRPLTKRTNGYSMETIIGQLNPILRGWFEYFQHSNRCTLETMDGWVRGRLRSILRKRHKGKGKGRGKDHFKWPNRHFAKLGLFSLAAARADARKSLRCNH